MVRRLVLVACALVVAGCGAATVHTGTLPIDSASLPTPVPTVEAPVPKLSPHGKEVLLKAREDKVPTVVLVISTEQGATESTAAALRDIGGTVEATDATIGYIRVAVPVELAEQAASVPGVSRVDVDEPIGHGDPTP